MPATATKKKSASPATSLARLNHELLHQAAADWRRWAIAVADGEGAPDARELLQAAAALSIQDPATALQDDSDAIVEARAAARIAADCEKNAAEMLAPFGGDPDAVLRAIDTAKAEVERLQAIYRDACDDCGAAHYRATLHRARVKASRIWPDYNLTGKAEVL
jgi:cytochrome c556